MSDMWLWVILLVGGPVGGWILWQCSEEVRAWTILLGGGAVVLWLLWSLVSWLLWSHPGNRPERVAAQAEAGWAQVPAALSAYNSSHRELQALLRRRSSAPSPSGAP